MRAGRIHRALLAAAALLPAPAAAAPGARFARLSVEQGLSQNTVQAVLQDHVGFLWFGTEEGLNRFDGYSFVVFKHDPADPHSLPHDAISALHEDGRRRLWVGTWRGLSLFDRATETFAAVAGIRQRVTAIADGPDGRLWVGTDGDGLFAVDTTERAVQYRHRDDDPASLASNAVSALRFDRQGRLWIGTRNAGLDVMEDGGAKHFRHHLGEQAVYGLAEDAAGSLWIATYGSGLSVRDPGSGRFRQFRHHPGDRANLGSDRLTCVLAGRSGSVWVGTDGAGVRRYDAATGRFVALVHEAADPFSPSQDVIRTLYEDAHGQLWVGTYLGGVNLLERERESFAYFTHRAGDPTGLADPVVTSFLEDARGRLWVGTERGFLHRYDRAAGTFARYRFPSAEAGGVAILALHEDERGRIWAGTYGGGLGRFDPERGSFAVHLPGAEVWAMAEAGGGALWLATGALERFDADRGLITTRHRPPGPEGHSGLRALLRDRRGDVWVGTESGLHVLRQGAAGLAGHRRPGSEGTRQDGAVALHEDRQGRLWVGTHGGGLHRVDPESGEVTAYRSFPSNVVYAVEEDSAGRLWVGTNRGLSRLDPATSEVQNFDLTTGLRSLQFRIGASLRTRRGELMFGSSDGFYDFNPEALTPDTAAPPLVLTSMRVLDRTVSLTRAPSTVDRIALTHRDTVLSLEFAALDHTLPRRNQYAYRMEGLSDAWIPLGGAREVTFTGLDPGRYVFQVKASNSHGVWSESPGAALEIVIQPPWWRTWWFQAASASLLAGLLLALHRARVRHLTADIAERQRTQELRESLRRSETMSAMGTLVAGVAHEVRNPLFSISANLEVLDTEIRRQQPCAETLSIIHAEVRRLRELMEELLAYGRPFSLHCTEEALGEVLGDAAGACDLLARRAEVTLANEVSPALPPVSVDRRRMVQVFQNLLENAIQHSPPGGRILACARGVWWEGRLWLECSIVDGGPGFQPQDLPRLFEPFFTRRHGGTGLGLSIVQRIVTAHGGAVTAENREEGGACMVVRLPAGGFPGRASA